VGIIRKPRQIHLNVTHKKNLFTQISLPQPQIGNICPKIPPPFTQKPETPQSPISSGLLAAKVMQENDPFLASLKYRKKLRFR